MIRFASDWQKYPHAIVDWDTPNKTFLRLATVYRSMGVRNHAFLLALHDSTLKGVDPHSPFLTEEQRLRIAFECKINPWYFFREVIKAPASGGTENTVFEASRGNICAYWLFFCHITFILIQPRQTGKSFGIDTLMVLLLNIICTNTKINLLTKDDKLRRENIVRLKAIMDTLPSFLLQRGKDPNDANNSEEVTIGTLGNSYSTHVPRSSEKDADKVGRGLTTAIMHIDEAPFQSHIKTALDAALGAMGAAIDKAKAAGAPWGTIFTTTAGKKDDRDGSHVYDMLVKSAIWDEKFFDAKDEAELISLISHASRGGVVRVAAVFNHRQLGKTDAWMREVLGRINPSPDAANRDFFNMWTSGSQSSPLKQSVLTTIAGSRLEVQHTEISPVRGYITRWYIPEDEITLRMTQGHYILSVDSSDAIGEDAISFLLTDVKTMEVIAAATINETSIFTFSEWLAAWFIRYRNITGIIERRSTGSSIIDHLLIRMLEHGIDPFKRLYNTVIQNHASDKQAYEEVMRSSHRISQDLIEKYKKCFGFATSGSGVTSRTNLYSTVLQFIAMKAGHNCRDSVLIDQILSLIVTTTGRVDHPKDGHDDMVIAWLLSGWLLTQGVNLAYYGMSSRDVLSLVDVPDHIDPQQEYFTQEQNALRQKIDDLTARLNNESDDFKFLNLEAQIRALMTKVVHRENEVLSFDELVRQARERRKKRNALNQNRGMGGGGNYYGYANSSISRTGISDRAGMYFDRAA